MGRPHTACGRQRCKDGIRACCLLCTWYMSGRCAHSSFIMRAYEREENRQYNIIPARTYKIIKPLVLKPGKSSYYTLPPEKKTSSARQALQSARIAPGPRSTYPAGLPVSEYLVVCRKVLVRRETLAKVPKIDKHTYIQGSPPGGVRSGARNNTRRLKYLHTCLFRTTVVVTAFTQH